MEIPLNPNCFEYNLSNGNIPFHRVKEFHYNFTFKRHLRDTTVYYNEPFFLKQFLIHVFNAHHLSGCSTCANACHESFVSNCWLIGLSTHFEKTGCFWIKTATNLVKYFPVVHFYILSIFQHSTLRKSLF